MNNAGGRYLQQPAKNERIKCMKLKRILSGVIGFPIVALILIYGNI